MFFLPVGCSKKYNVSFIPHYADIKKIDTNSFGLNVINILTTDYKTFITQVVQSSLVISSSLHGIILAETYGVPAILLLEDGKNMFKYEDWYHSTGRYDIVVARSLEEALNMTPMEVPDLTMMKKRLLDAFPFDLWK